MGKRLATGCLLEKSGTDTAVHWTYIGHESAYAGLAVIRELPILGYWSLVMAMVAFTSNVVCVDIGAAW